MTERLDYLQELGITAIELLPVFEFNELEYYTPIPGTDLFRYNFWGYSTVAFFAPMARFAADVRTPLSRCIVTAAQLTVASCPLVAQWLTPVGPHAGDLGEQRAQGPRA